MPDQTFQFKSKADGMEITAYRWLTTNPKAIVAISHGAAEHALRYDRFARALNDAGYAAWAMDHRGHGASAGPEGLGDFGSGGWDALVTDIQQMVNIAHEERPGLPVVLFGHSMGAAAAQQFTPDGSRTVDAVILSGSTAREVPREGDPPPPGPNASFSNPRTDYEWLSRDEAEVDKYIADPLCGFNMQRVRRPNARGDAAFMSDPERLKRIRPDLPVLFVAGDGDPVNRKLVGLHLLEKRWRDAGVQRIDKLYYEGGRHEMLNETNRDDVTRDIIAWMDGVVAR